MLTISNAISALFALIMAPFVGLPLTGMIVISAATGVLMLIIYKYTSNQKGIRKAKDRIKANFLAIMLFSDSLRVLIKSIGSILKWNLAYMGHNLKPLAVMMAPVLLLLVQLNFWYGYSPIKPGQTVQVFATVADESALLDTEAVLTSDEGVIVEAGAVRMKGSSEIGWRVRPETAGTHTLTITVGDQTETKQLVSAEDGKLYRLAPLRHNGNFWDGLLYPGEKGLKGNITSIRVEYPVVEMDFLAWKLHWIIVYFILSIVAGLSMKGLFKVDI
jgi:uncharacterized membrane protein (DUF106 family)